jgi:hypothetical protein
MHELFMVLFLVIPLKNPWEKVLDFGGFFRFQESGVLGGNPSIPLDLASFGGLNRSYGIPMRYS